MLASGSIDTASAQAPLPEPVDEFVSITQLKNDQWRFDCKLDSPVSGTTLGPPMPKYDAQAWDLPNTHETLTDPQMGFSFLERRDTSAFAEVSFQI